MKIALVTGASRGIGRATAELFAEQGTSVILNYNQSEAQAKALEASINSKPGGRAIAIRADVADKAQVQAMFRQAEETFGVPDVLVNNAGVAAYGLMTDMDANEWDALFAVNLRGIFLCAKYALHGMVPRKQGSIVNVSSMWGITGACCEVCYSASKAGVIGFTKALAKEVGPSGVRVNCVAPGLVQTDMAAALDDEAIESIRQETPLMKTGSPQDIAQAICYLASGGAGFVTGQVLQVDGGFAL